MSKGRKIILGILTFAPFIGMLFYMIAFIFLFAAIPSVGSGGGGDVPWAYLGTFGTMAAILLISGLLSLGLMIYYIIHVVNNKDLNAESNEPLIWILIMLFAGNIGQAIYFYLKIWKDHPKENDLVLDQ